MTFFQQTIISAICGLVLGIVGPQLIGVLAAVPVPMSFFNGFDNPRLAVAVIDTVSALLAFGLLAASIGYALGLYFKRWFVGCTVCYVSFLTTLSLSTSPSAQSILVAPYPLVDFYTLPSILMVPTLMFIAGFFAAQSKLRSAK